MPPPGHLPDRGWSPHHPCLPHCRWALYCLTAWEATGPEETGQSPEVKRGVGGDPGLLRGLSGRGKRALRPQAKWLTPSLPEWACNGGRLESKGKGWAGRGCLLTSPFLLRHTGPTGGAGLAGAEAIRSSPSTRHNRLCGQGASWSQGSWEIHLLCWATALPVDLLPTPRAVTASQPDLSGAGEEGFSEEVTPLQNPKGELEVPPPHTCCL